VIGNSGSTRTLRLKVEAAARELYEVTSPG